MSIQDGIVKVVFDKDGYILRAGEMISLTKQEKQEVADVIIAGGYMKEIHISEYRTMDKKWMFEKQINKTK